jgi:hypothetical protein
MVLYIIITRQALFYFQERYICDCLLQGSLLGSSMLHILLYQMYTTLNKSISTTTKPQKNRVYLKNCKSAAKNVHARIEITGKYFQAVYASNIYRQQHVKLNKNE